MPPVDQITLGVISYQPIGPSMAGPAIRALELARTLARDVRVILYAPAGSEMAAPGLGGLEFVPYTEEELDEAIAPCDALLCQGFTLDLFPDLGSLDKFLIIDLYVPLSLEALVSYAQDDPEEQERIQGHVLMATLDRLSAGDFFICASERQRDYWLGWLSAAGRVTPEAYSEDPDLRRLIDVVPFGIPGEPPAAAAPVLKGVDGRVAENDRLLLWGGGIYNWLDPFTPIRAVARLAEERDDVKLFFLGARHPDPNVPAMEAYDRAIELSRELGVLDSAVIFNDEWVPYEDRVPYLLEADLGVNANIPHIETHFSFRTRILDCIWAGVPLVSTAGDPLSDLIGSEGLGLVVASGDVEAYADAIVRLLGDGELYGRCRDNLASVAVGFSWSAAAGCIRRLLTEGDLSRTEKGGSLDQERLWSLVAAKDRDIEELWGMVREKDEHIVQLREMVTAKDDHIDDYRRMVKLREREIEQLKDRSQLTRLRNYKLRITEAIQARRGDGGKGKGE